MGKPLFAIILLFISWARITAHEINISKNIKPELSNLLEKDLVVLENLTFRPNPDPKALLILNIDQLTNASVEDWLHTRVKYIIEENAFSGFWARLTRTLFVEQSNVIYPNANIIPANTNNNVGTNPSKSSITMTNVGAAYYIQGKSEHKLYGIKFSDRDSNKTIPLRIDSPRAGILQIGAGLFDPHLAINRTEPNAIANSIFRLSFLLHEARHSDGHGPSLGFTHSLCPKGHDYEGELACDESLNGAYSVGAYLAREMMLACDDQCSDRDKEMLKIFIIDNLNRIQNKTTTGQNSTNWDISPEEI